MAQPGQVCRPGGRIGGSPGFCGPGGKASPGGYSEGYEPDEQCALHFNDPGEEIDNGKLTIDNYGVAFGDDLNSFPMKDRM